ncbi:YggS family pyridoxal phosphate enzyme [Arthrobacter gengyunqii]|uniref:Pyridoxal phosphate homeostasis protein n=1 Tax=Arthrobacter gengyunqii TaxID=2886940 RepID=A0A9X1M4P9_9MICC|nr:YggS family pyridoxal phosphate enzyme [Arthrobacter gengyunqii]MCC3270562.1 YggS family pyridoxal phosphate enzyme [Arthrobacter gengyunqii]UOY97392.1 YggS family pyridoxal phosphate enzyme [Arthrobacter gengyunqii]
MTASITPAERSAELTARLQRVRTRIRSAVAGPAEPTLIVVTKYFPASDVELLAALGVTEVGENKDQEAAAKASSVQAQGLNWHFIGQLQSNKAKSVVRYAAAVHSVDRLSLVTALGKAMAAEQSRRTEAGVQPRADLDVFLQVDLREQTPAAGSSGGGAGTGAARGGALPRELPDLAEAAAATPGLRLAGVMAVAPLGADPQEAFAKLAGLSGNLQKAHPGATGISAGMSGDLEAALQHGATHLRIGSDILGPRPPVR